MAQIDNPQFLTIVAAGDLHRPFATGDLRHSFYAANPHSGFGNTPKPPQIVNRLTPSAPEAKATAETPPSSLWSRLKSAISPIIDNNRAYAVPKHIQANTITLERAPYIKVTTDLTASSRDGFASDAPAAVRNREVWVKLDEASYKHLVDMAVHYPVLQDHTQDRLIGSAREEAVKASGLKGAYNFEAGGILKFPTAEYRGMDLSHIANQIQIDIDTTGYIKPVSGDNRTLADGEYVKGTAKFTGFTQDRLPANDPNPYGAIQNRNKRFLSTPSDFGLREEGLSAKTRELASTRNPYHMPTLNLSM